MAERQVVAYPGQKDGIPKDVVVQCLKQSLARFPAFSLGSVDLSSHSPSQVATPPGPRTKAVPFRLLHSKPGVQGLLPSYTGVYPVLP